MLRVLLLQIRASDGDRAAGAGQCERVAQPRMRFELVQLLHRVRHLGGCSPYFHLACLARDMVQEWSTVSPACI